MKIAILWSVCFYHVFYMIVKMASSWAQILTEFGWKSCQLQSWIYHSTDSTDGESLLHHKDSEK